MIDTLKQALEALDEAIGSTLQSRQATANDWKQAGIESAMCSQEFADAMTRANAAFTQCQVAAIDLRAAIKQLEEAEPVAWKHYMLYGMYEIVSEKKDAKDIPLYPAPVAPAGWQPIETAPKAGNTILLGFRTPYGNWRTMRGQWYSKELIAEEWSELDDEADPAELEGWYETSVEADDIPNCWITEPSHWMPLPAAPEYKP